MSQRVVLWCKKSPGRVVLVVSMISPWLCVSKKGISTGRDMRECEQGEEVDGLQPAGKQAQGWDSVGRPVLEIASDHTCTELV